MDQPRTDPNLQPQRGAATGTALGLLVVALLVAWVAVERATARTDPAAAATAAGEAEVVRVIDGDTIIATVAGVDEHIRLIGIDTPETHKPNSPVECFGPEASARTSALLPPGTTIRLERDVEARDRYDRLLAYVFRADDGLLIAEALAAEGLAAALDIAPNSAYRNRIGAAAATAKAAGLGLWGACGGPHQPAP